MDDLGVPPFRKPPCLSSKWMINPTWMILLSISATATKRSGSNWLPLFNGRKTKWSSPPDDPWMQSQSCPVTSGQASCRVVRTAVNAESLLSSTRPGGTERIKRIMQVDFLKLGTQAICRKTWLVPSILGLGESWILIHGFSQEEQSPRIGFVQLCRVAIPIAISLTTATTSLLTKKWNTTQT